MPSRLEEYRALLNAARQNGYRGISILDAYRELCMRPEAVPDRRLLILRHDIDSDSATGRQMWEIEKSLGFSATYYFRFSTVNFDHMREIETEGGEASYHYEELAILAKGLRLRDRDSLAYYLPAARQLFKLNVEHFRHQSGLPIRTVASHGDFINRRLRMSNEEILCSTDLRKEMGIDLEAYDEALMSRVNIYTSDIRPSFPDDVVKAISAKLSIIYMLTHPKHWRVNRRENLRMIGERLAEGALYLLR